MSGDPTFTSSGNNILSRESSTRRRSSAVNVLDGDFEWLEEGIVGLQDIGLPE